MRIYYCPLPYLDDDLLLDLHRSYHRIEKSILNKNTKSITSYEKFFFQFPYRRNWFLQLHDKIISELTYRYRKTGKKYVHNSPQLMRIMSSLTKTWMPPIEYIENDINYLKFRYRFKNKNIVYTNRPLPEFLKNINRDLLLSCKTCIKNKECKLMQKEKFDYCESWNNGEVIYNKTYPDPITKLQF